MRRIFAFVLIASVVYVLFFAPGNIIERKGGSTRTFLPGPGTQTIVTEPQIVYQDRIVTQEVIVYVTSVPEATQTPQPTFTPAPTYTPYPTLTPVVLKSPELMQSERFTNSLAMLFAAVTIFFIAGGFIYIKLREVELKHKEEMKRLEASKPAERPIVTNRVSRNQVISSRNVAFDKTKIAEFVLNVRSVGLSINQWRKKMNWSQKEIEDMLNWLQDSHLISERSDGQAATWIVNVGTIGLSRKLGMDWDEINQYSNKGNEEEQQEAIVERMAYG